ncbi:MAG: site-specific integrase [Candidatus Parvarchaeota archaeon]|nr:site-specific integrase [Candidatus Parvarchaeota archaeon]
MENIDLINRFMQQLDREGFKEKTKNWYLIAINKFQKTVKSEISIVLSEDVDKFFLFLRNSNFTFETKKHYLSRLRKFALWLNPDLRLPKYRFQFKEKRILPHETLSVEEVRKMVDSAENIRDKAIISLLYDTGCRPHELLSLKRQDVMLDASGLFVCVPEECKTGARQIPVILTAKSHYYLEQYLESANLKPMDKLFDLCVEWLNRLVKTLAGDLAKEKHIYSYIFRHSRATFLSQYLTESQLCVYFGWRQGSDMPKIYVHLSGRDILPVVMEMNRKLI